MADTTPRLVNKGRVRCHTGTTDIDISAAVYTGWITLLTITPATGQAIKNLNLELDLAKATTGFAAGHTTETVQFAWARKVDGTNLRTHANTATTAISGTNAAAGGQLMRADYVDDGVPIVLMVKLSAEAADTTFPYRCTYESGAAATFTEVLAG